MKTQSDERDAVGGGPGKFALLACRFQPIDGELSCAWFVYSSRCSQRCKLCCRSALEVLICRGFAAGEFVLLVRVCIEVSVIVRFYGPTRSVVNRSVRFDSLDKSRVSAILFCWILLLYLLLNFPPLYLEICYFDGIAGATEAISVAGLALSVITAVATSSWCVYFCSRNENYTIEQLKKRRRDLGDKLRVLKTKEEEQAVLVQGNRELSCLIEEAEAFFSTLSEADIGELENRINARCMCNRLRNVCAENQARVSMEVKLSKLISLIGKAETVLQKPVKGYKLSGKVKIVGQERRKEIWKAISTPDSAGTVCIHGCLGVGKTAIAISIHNKALKEQHNGLFDYVIWVAVEYGDGLRQVQEKIAERLGIDLSNNPSSTGDRSLERASRLKTTLENKGKFLMVLDSMWEPLSLLEIGIPALVDGRKLIVTSRLSTICGRINEKPLFYEVKPLPSPDKPWELFHKKLGFNTLPQKLDHNNASLTEEVVAGLDGIPLAINKLAETLCSIHDDDDIEFNRAWRKVLGLAENPKDEELIKRFKPSYDNLKLVARRCFLYCALLPKDHPIQSKELIEYWMLEGLLGDMDVDKLQKLMEDGREILKELENAHLLQVEGSVGDEKFKMLSLVRSIAIDTMDKEEVHFLNGICIFRPRGVLTSLTIPPSVHDDWNPDKGSISTLLLQDNPLDSNSHNTDFFRNMPNLRILDLSRTDISTLPNSLSNLTNLHALLLRSCPNLRKVPNLSELEQLIVLDLSGTPLEHCPEGIKDMENLRRLDLSQTRLAAFPAGVVDKLAELEELLMITDAVSGGYVWGSKELDKQWQGACIEELMGLKNLAVLQLNFLDAKVFDMYVNKVIKKHNNVPPKFRFWVGHGLQRGIAGDGENSVAIIGDHSLTLPYTTLELHLTTCREKISVLEVEKRCLSNLEVLDLSDFSLLTYLFPVEIFESLEKLRELRVTSCKEMVDVVKADIGSNPAPIITLPRLSKILFSNLPKFKTLCCRRRLNCPLLTLVEVQSCMQMKLPRIYHRNPGAGTANSRPNIFEFQIRGERRWLDNVYRNGPGESSNPDFQPYRLSNFKLYEIVPPESYNGTATYREYRKEPQEGDISNNNAMHASGQTSRIVSTTSNVAAASHVVSKPHKYISTIELLEDKKRALGVLINGLKQRENMGAVFVPHLSSFIENKEALLKETDEVLEKWIQGQERKACVQNMFTKLDILVQEAETLSQNNVKGYMQLPEVDIVGRMRTQTREEIWKAVSAAEEVGTVFIHGTLGVGKTEIAISIHNQALKEEDELFDHVVWVNVEYGDTLWQVQEAIARRLGIELPNNADNPASNGEIRAVNADEIVVERAEELRNALLRKRKLLLVLDSMWQPLSLASIGIPEPANGLKLIVTSRIRTVCGDDINNKLFEIQPLPAEEAWELFEAKMGSLPRLKPETVASTKTALLAGLDGLPLAISRLAQRLSSLTKRKPAILDQAWSDELEELAKDPAVFTKPWDSVLNNQFKQSYENLREATRHCFQFCALFPKDHLFESRDLIEYWMFEGLLGEDIKTLAKGYKKGMKVLKELVDATLLRTGTGENFKMLSLVRSMTIDTMVNEEQRQVIIRSGCSLSKLPSGREWPPAVERASFMQNRLEVLDLRGKPNCSGLSTLLLQDNSSLGKLSDKFFSGMHELKVLDLSRTKITALPNSLSDLRTLRALLLRNCANLARLPNLSNLQQVIVLDLSGTPLELCPQGIQKMGKLRRLNLSQTELAKFPANVVGQLTELEELLMITDHDCVWGSGEDGQWKGACIEELLGLTKLAVLQLHFLNAEAFTKYVNTALENTQGLPKFRFRVGEIQTDETFEENSLAISGLVANSTSNLPELNMIIPLKLMYLDVCNFSGSSHLFSVEILKSLTQLRELRVRSCKEVVEVVLPAEDQGTVCLPQLTKMVFFELPSLTSLCRGQGLDCPNLVSIGVWRCDKLELPVIHPGSNKIQLRGETNWLNTLKWNNHTARDSDTPFSFADESLPSEYFNTAATATDRRPHDDGGIITRFMNWVW